MKSDIQNQKDSWEAKQKRIAIERERLANHSKELISKGLQLPLSKFMKGGAK